MSVERVISALPSDQSPVVIVHGQHIQVTWPNGRPDQVLVAADVVEGWAESLNRLRDALVGVVNIIGPESICMCEPADPDCVRCLREEAGEALRIAGEALGRPDA